MKSFVFLFAAVALSVVANAQTHSVLDSTIATFKSKIRVPNKSNFKTHTYVRSNDDFVVQLQQPVLSFQFNMNRIDVYQATPDHIYVIKPDNTVSFNMPVADFPNNE